MAEVVIFLQRAWRCTLLDLDEDTGVYEKPCGMTLVPIVSHALEQVIASHLSGEHQLPNEMWEEDLGGYDFDGFGE